MNLAQTQATKLMKYAVGLVILLPFITAQCYGHDKALHERISEVAANSASGLSTFLAESLGSANAPFDRLPLLVWPASTADHVVDSPLGWLKQGSKHEDDNPRYLNHFYAATRATKELTDYSRTARAALAIFRPGEPMQSFTWASTRGVAPSDSNKRNAESWQNARDYQFQVVTRSSPVGRNTYLAEMLFSLGKVVHLNQDLSQPGHTRNDAHAPNDKVWIENHGLDNYQKHPSWFDAPPQNRRGWTYWRGEGFQRLEDFWDRHKYTGVSAVPLDADAHGDANAKLGLAEFSNGNFLSEDSNYAECMVPGTEDYNLHYFPFPKRNTSVNYVQVKARLLAANLIPMDYADGTSGSRVYLRKVADGFTGSDPSTGFRHSVLPYLKVARLDSPSSASWDFREGRPHINHAGVLDDYLGILLSKAVEYSAGILDYFFRGKLEVCVEPDYQPGHYYFSIRNRSGQDFKGGSFKLYWDDVNGMRTPLQSPAFTTTYNGSLPDNQAVDGFFTAPPAATSYTLVFQGIIGSDGNTALDSVDGENALAVKTFRAPNTPWSLCQAVNNVLGTVAITPNGSDVSFPNTSSIGSYQVEYISGHFINGVLDYPGGNVIGTSLWTEQPSGGVRPIIKYESSAAAWSEGTGESSCWGATGAQIEAYTAAHNPVFGPYWFHAGVTVSLGCGWSGICSSWEQPGGGAMQLRLREVCRGHELPDRLRIHEFSTIKNVLGGCASCGAGSGAEWDGTLPYRDWFGDRFCYYDSEDDSWLGPAQKKINAMVWFSPGEWRLEVYCDGTTIWEGVKLAGITAEGEYTQDICTPGQCTTLSAITLESY